MFHVKPLKKLLTTETCILAVGASKRWLLLQAKLRMTKLNAWENIALGSTFRCMCNYDICFEVHVNTTVFIV